MSCCGDFILAVLHLPSCFVTFLKVFHSNGQDFPHALVCSVAGRAVRVQAGRLGRFPAEAGEYKPPLR